MSDDDDWLIHKEGRGWYRPNSQGYSNNVAEAGRYSYEDARAISHPNGLDGPRDGMTIRRAITMIPAPCEGGEG